jgi:hypothetical protein
MLTVHHPVEDAERYNHGASCTLSPCEHKIGQHPQNSIHRDVGPLLPWFTVNHKVGRVVVGGCDMHSRISTFASCEVTLIHSQFVTCARPTSCQQARKQGWPSARTILNRCVRMVCQHYSVALHVCHAPKVLKSLLAGSGMQCCCHTRKSMLIRYRIVW